MLDEQFQFFQYEEATRRQASQSPTSRAEPIRFPHLNWEADSSGQFIYADMDSGEPDSLGRELQITFQ